MKTSSDITVTLNGKQYDVTAGVPKVRYRIRVKNGYVIPIRRWNQTRFATSPSHGGHYIHIIKKNDLESMIDDIVSQFGSDFEIEEVYS